MPNSGNDTKLNVPNSGNDTKLNVDTPNTEVETIKCYEIIY